jgi:hypothetical protein
MVLYILTFTFPDSRRDDKRVLTLQFMLVTPCHVANIGKQYVCVDLLAFSVAVIIQNLLEYYLFLLYLLYEPGNSVSTVSIYGLDYLAIEVRFPTEAKGFFL